MTVDKTENTDLIQVLQDALQASQTECKKLRKDNYLINERLKRKSSTGFDDFYTYSTPDIELAPGGGGVASISIDSGFYVTKLVHTGSNFKFLITEKDLGNIPGDVGQQWSNVPLHSLSNAGNGSAPLILPKPRYINSGSVIFIELKNLLDTKTTVSLSLIGYKRDQPY